MWCDKQGVKGGGLEKEMSYSRLRNAQSAHYDALAKAEKTWIRSLLILPTGCIYMQPAG